MRFPSVHTQLEHADAANENWRDVRIEPGPRDAADIMLATYGRIDALAVVNEQLDIALAEGELHATAFLRATMALLWAETGGRLRPAGPRR